MSPRAGIREPACPSNLFLAEFEVGEKKLDAPFPPSLHSSPVHRTTGPALHRTGPAGR